MYDVGCGLRSDEESDDDEGDDQEKAADSIKRRRHTTRLTVDESVSSKQDAVLRKHPLAVHINIKCKGTAS